MREDSGPQPNRSLGRQQYFMYQVKWYAAAVILVGLVVLGALATLPHSNAATPDCVVSGPGSTSVAAPDGLTAEADVVNTVVVIRLTWNDNSDNETCFVVERMAESETQFTIIGVVPGDTSVCLDNDLPDDDIVAYRVYAANADARSSDSNEASTVIPTSLSGASATATATPETTCNSLEETPTATAPSPGVTLTPGPTPGGRGDIDCNGTINSKDALALLAYLADVSPTPVC